MTQVEDDGMDELLPVVRKLYPELKEEELREAALNLKEYFDVVLGMCERRMREVREKIFNSPKE